MMIIIVIMMIIMISSSTSSINGCMTNSPRLQNHLGKRLAKEWKRHTLGAALKLPPGLYAVPWHNGER